MGGDGEDGVFVGGFDRFEPGRRDAIGEQFAIGHVGEGQRFVARRGGVLDDRNFVDNFAEFNQLRGAGFGWVSSLRVSAQ